MKVFYLNWFYNDDQLAKIKKLADLFGVEIEEVLEVEEIMNKVSKEPNALGILPYHLIPLVRDVQIVLAGALMRLEKMMDSFYYEVDQTSSRPVINLKDKAKIAVFSKRAYLQIKELFPDLILEIFNNLNEGIDQDFDGYLIEEGMVFENVKEKFNVFKFNPKEFIPLAGQGTLGVIHNLEDNEWKHKINLTIDQNLTKLVNIERRITLALSKEGLNDNSVYCIDDRFGNYHLYYHICKGESAVRGRFSSATSAELVEQVLEQIRQELSIIELG